MPVEKSHFNEFLEDIFDRNPHIFLPDDTPTGDLGKHKRQRLQAQYGEFNSSSHHVESASSLLSPQQGGGTSTNAPAFNLPGRPTCVSPGAPQPPPHNPVHSQPKWKQGLAKSEEYPGFLEPDNPTRILPAMNDIEHAMESERIRISAAPFGPLPSRAFDPPPAPTLVYDQPLRQKHTGKKFNFTHGIGKERLLEKAGVTVEEDQWLVMKELEGRIGQVRQKGFKVNTTRYEKWVVLQLTDILHGRVSEEEIRACF